MVVFVKTKELQNFGTLKAGQTHQPLTQFACG